MADAHGVGDDRLIDDESWPIEQSFQITERLTMARSPMWVPAPMLDGPMTVAPAPTDHAGAEHHGPMIVAPGCTAALVWETTSR